MIEYRFSSALWGNSRALSATHHCELWLFLLMPEDCSPKALDVAVRAQKLKAFSPPDNSDPSWRHVLQSSVFPSFGFRDEHTGCVSLNTSSVYTSASP